MLTIRLRDISETELTSQNLKTGKKIRFPLFTGDGQPTSVKLTLDDVHDFYRAEAENRASKKKPAILSPFLFHNRTGGSYWNVEKATCSGFDSIWQRHMKKALTDTQLGESFTDHDLRTKVASDLDTDQEASDLLAHSSLQITQKHYRLKGQKVTPAPGFSIPKRESK